MSLCTAIDFQIEDFLANSSGLGLNLSTNNGLDLTCPTYEEGLNLTNQQATQSGGGAQNHGSGHEQGFNYNEPMVLNLTQPVGNQQVSHLHPSNRHHQTIGQNTMHILQQPHSYSYVSSGQDQNEVGLNLSLQKSYASHGQSHTEYFNQYTSQGQGATSDFVYSTLAPASNAVEQQRNSPLNLERRASPLNLTSVQVSTNSGRPYVNDFSFSTPSANYQQTYGYYGQTVHQSQNSDSSLFVQNMFDENQFFVSSSNEMMMTQDSQQSTNQHQQVQLQQQSGQKIRLFCSSCCTEFNSTMELNRHMDRHLTEALSAMQRDLQDDNQQQQNQHHEVHQEPEVQNHQIQQQEMLTSYQNHHHRSDVISCQGKQLAPNWSGANDPFQVLATSQNNCQNELAMVSQSTSLGDIQGPMHPHSSSASNSTSKKHPNRPLPALITATSGMEITNNSTKKTNEPHEVCLDCSIAFPTGIDLKKHMDLAHQGRTENIFQCSKCSKEFSTKRDLGEHIETHNQGRCIKCPKCGVQLSNPAILKRHLLRVHEKSKQSFKCQQCGKGFYEKHDLTRHLKTHSAQKCSFCQKTLTPSVDHNCKKMSAKDGSEDPDLKCTICSAQLETKVAWGIHMWKHTKNPSYIQIPPVETKVQEQSLQDPKSPLQSSTKVAENSSKKVELVSRPKVNPLPPISTLGRMSSSGFSNWMDKDFPQAPDAHATSYMQAQLSEPLCLQKSRVDVQHKEQIKPLNMQIVMSSNLQL